MPAFQSKKITFNADLCAHRRCTGFVMHSLNVIRVLAFSILSVMRKNEREVRAVLLPRPPVGHLTILRRWRMVSRNLVLQELWRTGSRSCKPEAAFAIHQNDKIARFLLQLHNAVVFLHFLCYHNIQRCRVLSSLGSMVMLNRMLCHVAEHFCISGGKCYGGQL